MLRLAVPNKGALTEDAQKILAEAGYRRRKDSKELVVVDPENSCELFFLRPRDIAVYVSNGVLDMGITGRDLIADSGSKLVELMPLRFGKASFRYAVPRNSGLTPEQFGGLRIATSYVNLVEQDLARRGIEATVVHLDGAVEISIQLGVADVVADVVQTGRTLEQAGLAVVGESILESEAVLVGREATLAQQHNGVKLFLDRLRGILVAREYVMVEYDVPVAQLERAIAITPGIESPTIAPLSKADWRAVKAMARKKDVNPIMDELSALGAKGIIITDIRTCRI